jgi:hypothetical protein
VVWVVIDVLEMRDSEGGGDTPLSVSCWARVVSVSGGGSAGVKLSASFGYVRSSVADDDDPPEWAAAAAHVEGPSGQIAWWKAAWDANGRRCRNRQFFTRGKKAAWDEMRSAQEALRLLGETLGSVMAGPPASRLDAMVSDIAEDAGSHWPVSVEDNEPPDLSGVAAVAEIIGRCRGPAPV